MTTTPLPARHITTRMRIHWQGRDVLVTEVTASGTRRAIRLQDGRTLTLSQDTELDVVRKAS